MRGYVAVTAVPVFVMCFSSDVASFSLLSSHQQQYDPSRQVIRELQPQLSLLNTIQRRRNPQGLAAGGGGEQPQIISPFDNSAANSDSDAGSVATTTTTTSSNEILDLTYENVELVLDSMRHYLIQDGGNVVIDEIDGPIVKLQLQGNCGTCPSSTQTMKMGYVADIDM